MGECSTLSHNSFYLYINIRQSCFHFLHYSVRNDFLYFVTVEYFTYSVNTNRNNAFNIILNRTQKPLQCIIVDFSGYFRHKFINRFFGNFSHFCFVFFCFSAVTISCVCCIWRIVCSCKVNSHFSLSYRGRFRKNRKPPFFIYYIPRKRVSRTPFLKYRFQSIS